MFVCHTRHRWGVIVMGENMIGVHEGSFLTVNMDRCKDITEGPFEHVTPGPTCNSKGTFIAQIHTNPN